MNENNFDSKYACEGLGQPSAEDMDESSPYYRAAMIILPEFAQLDNNVKHQIKCYVADHKYMTDDDAYALLLGGGLFFLRNRSFFERIDDKNLSRFRGALRRRREKRRRGQNERERRVLAR
jgi:hypothetical protein